MSTTGVAITKEIAQQQEAPRLRLEYLDGLRGLAALYVVIFHIFGIWKSYLYKSLQPPQPYLHKPIKLLNYVFFDFGHPAVTVFIVLSGYVLMLPIARTRDGRMPKGMWDYFKRRARRILPPYYAVFFLCLFLIKFIPNLKQLWDNETPHLTCGVVVAHLLLIHNFSKAWEGKFNGALWSIAVEWQIYFWFPLLLLPIWRRFGLLTTILFAWIFGLTGYYLYRIGGTSSWFIGDFAFGMAAAIIGFWQMPNMVALRERFPWYKLAAIFGGLAYFLLVDQRRFMLRNPYLRWLTVDSWHIGTGKVWPIEFLVGLATCCFIIGSTLHLQKGFPDNWPLRFLHHRAIIRLGTFSYSLYLIHIPVIVLMDRVLFQFDLSSNSFVIYHFCLALPLCIGFAYLFYLLFERPFLPTHLRTGQAKSLEKIVERQTTFT